MAAVLMGRHCMFRSMASGTGEISQFRKDLLDLEEKPKHKEHYVHEGVKKAYLAFFLRDPLCPLW